MKHIFLLLVTLIFISAISSAQNLLAIPDTLNGKTFNLNILDTSNQFYVGKTTKTYGVNTSYLGPTLFLNKGDSVSMMVTNTLSDTTTIHWHGMHVSALNDGGPHITISPKTTWNPRFIVRDHAATYWYHPHLHMKTNLHASLGAAGLIIVRDTTENKLVLPRRYGLDDFPLVVQSKCFDTNKQIVIDNASDSVVMVNGTLNPYLPVPAQVIRLRLLNASSERVYNFGFQGNLTFYQIASDGGLLNSSVALTRLRLAPGERAEIVIDLNGKTGQSINLMSFASELPSAIYGALQPGMGPGQTIPGYKTNLLNGSDYAILKLNITAQTLAPIITIPAALTNNIPWLTTNAKAFRTLTFMPVNMGPTAIQGPFMINNAHFNMDVINYSIPFNNIEVWTLFNQSPIAHPFHIHDVQFFVTEINGAAPPANLAGRKDVILVQAGQTVKFITKFETFCDSMAMYMYHCHMLTHEDGGMMGQFNVICPPVSTGIEYSGALKNELSVYPNPTSDKITLSTNTEDKITSYSLFDFSGKLVAQKTGIHLSTASLDLAAYSQGIYLISIQVANKNYIRKINLAK